VGRAEGRGQEGGGKRLGWDLLIFLIMNLVSPTGKSWSLYTRAVGGVAA